MKVRCDAMRGVEEREHVRHLTGLSGKWSWAHCSQYKRLQWDEFHLNAQVSLPVIRSIKRMTSSKTSSTVHRFFSVCGCRACVCVCVHLLRCPQFNVANSCIHFLNYLKEWKIKRSYFLIVRRNDGRKITATHWVGSLCRLYLCLTMFNASFFIFINFSLSRMTCRTLQFQQVRNDITAHVVH